MRRTSFLLLFLLLVFTGTTSFAAVFGTVIAPRGGAAYSDIVLDESRARLYLVNSTLNQIDIYNLKTRAFATPIKTHTQPLSAALSRDNKFLYVTAYASLVLDVIDLSKDTISTSINLPTGPEGVAVGVDNRVLISAVSPAGTSTTNTLLIYDPAKSLGNNLQSVSIAPPPPTPPVLPTPSGRVFVSYRGKLAPTKDGRFIVGANGNTGTSKVVFVYEVASGTVLRSRSISNLSSALSISPDGTKFMAGSSLFDLNTLQVLAQENASNAPFGFAAGANFNLQANQGGSVFAPGGNLLYAAFNIAPVGVTRANTTQLLLNDPDNLLIKTGIQLPENMAGKMVTDATGANIYAISDSGFTIIPIGNLNSVPVVNPASRSVLLLSDQCGVFSAQSVGIDATVNSGTGRYTIAVAPYTAATTGLGGGGGAGGGIIIILPGGGGIVIPGGGGGGIFNPGGGGGGTVNLPTNATGPIAQLTSVNGIPGVQFRYNPQAARNPGTVGPSDYQITSPEAVNLPGNIHVYQNNRDSVAGGKLNPVQLNQNAGEGLTDMYLDSARNRIYITNSGLNRVEVFNTTTGIFLPPIKVGQLPHGMALSPDGTTLYVQNTGGESISMIDLVKGVQTGIVEFPAIPFNSGVALITPQAIAATGRGPQMVMSDGTLWKITGNQAIPRPLNKSVFGPTATSVAAGNPALRVMASTPGGEYVLLFTGTGNAYLYDYTVDDYVLGKQVLNAPLSGYIGPITAGPGGNYYLVGGTLLNSSLTPSADGSGIGAVGGGTLPGAAIGSGRPVSAVAAISNTLVAEFTEPVRANGTATVGDAGQIELYDPANGRLSGIFPALEGSPSQVTGTGRAVVIPHAMAVDTRTNTAYVLTASGLQIVALANTPAGTRPAINPGAVVNYANFTTAIAAGGLMTIFGKNLASDGTGKSPLPTILGNACVTVNNVPIPLLYTSSGQINAQVPTTLAAGRYPLVVRNLTTNSTSVSTILTVAKYAPAILLGPGGSPSIYHSDGSAVTTDNPANRDQHLVIYATGLGPTKGGTVTTGVAAPAKPLAVTDPVSVTIGTPGYSQANMIVNWAGLVPGLIGIDQINITVPGSHMKGPALPVVVKIGGVSSPAVGASAAFIPVE